MPPDDQQVLYNQNNQDNLYDQCYKDVHDDQYNIDDKDNQDNQDDQDDEMRQKKTYSKRWNMIFFFFFMWKNMTFDKIWNEMWQFSEKR